MYENSKTVSECCCGAPIEPRREDICAKTKKIHEMAKEANSQARLIRITIFGSSPEDCGCNAEPTCLNDELDGIGHELSDLLDILGTITNNL